MKNNNLLTLLNKYILSRLLQITVNVSNANAGCAKWNSPFTVQEKENNVEIVPKNKDVFRKTYALYYTQLLAASQPAD